MGAIKIGVKLGRGSQGIVYEGELDAQRIAVKQYLEFDVVDFDLLEKLSHPNIVRLR